eukprot:TRINITY_DN1667_c0_g1_i3.p1 TRINITY_DN1667_c0_g1~~TRINITY_DN1667_c0_g1_i3.p1  ORF type:complete len:101 (-),score=8.39 TRINITY_DN1667_c0_g1_i3:317-619(-)
MFTKTTHKKQSVTCYPKMSPISPLCSFFSFLFLFVFFLHCLKVWVCFFFNSCFKPSKLFVKWHQRFQKKNETISSKLCIFRKLWYKSSDVIEKSFLMKSV